MKVIKNQADQSAVIEIEEVIGGDGWWDPTNTRKWLREQLEQIKALKGEITHLRVNINSPGGDVDSALAIHDMIRELDAATETRIYGLSASAATIIAQAGDVRKQSDNAIQMIHQASGGVWGNAEAHEKAVQILRKLDEKILDIYMKRSSIDREKMKEYMNQETYFNADEALAAGLIDEVFEPEAAMPIAAMKIDLDVAEKLNMNLPGSLIPVLKDGKIEFLNSKKVGRFNALDLDEFTQQKDSVDQKEENPLEQERLLCLQQIEQLINKTN